MQSSRTLKPGEWVNAAQWDCEAHGHVPGAKGVECVYCVAGVMRSPDHPVWSDGPPILIGEHVTVHRPEDEMPWEGVVRMIHAEEIWLVPAHSSFDGGDPLDAAPAELRRIYRSQVPA